MVRSAARAQRRAGAGAVVCVASLTAAVLTSGMQGIVPAIPAIRDHFGLSNFEVGLVTSVYLLPGVFSAFAAGWLTQRIGERKVVVGGLAVFGLGGGILLVGHDLATLLAVRFVQGIVFGALLSMTVGIIGSVGPHRAGRAPGQSRRIVAMAAAEALFPIAGGLMLALAWYAPFSMQILALPLAVVAWFVLSDGERPPTARDERHSGGIGLEGAGYCRGPAARRRAIHLQVRGLDLHPGARRGPCRDVRPTVGWLVGACSALSAVIGPAVRTARGPLRSSEMILGCMLLIGISLVLIGSAECGGHGGDRPAALRDTGRRLRRRAQCAGQRDGACRARGWPTSGSPARSGTSENSCRRCLRGHIAGAVDSSDVLRLRRSGCRGRGGRAQRGPRQKAIERTT